MRHGNIGYVKMSIGIYLLGRRLAWSRQL